jgi:hypothetical protein
MLNAVVAVAVANMQNMRWLVTMCTLYNITPAVS